MCVCCRSVPPFAFQLCIVSVRTDQLYKLQVVSYTMLIIHKRWYYGLRVGFYPAFDAKFLVNRHPRHLYHPCMVYLPTFTHINYNKHQPFHAGKYTTYTHLNIYRYIPYMSGIRCKSFMSTSKICPPHRQMRLFYSCSAGDPVNTKNLLESTDAWNLSMDCFGCLIQSCSLLLVPGESITEKIFFNRIWY